MDAIVSLMTRVSQAQLCAPAPSDAALETAFACALRAPDHRLLRPWRYLVIRQPALSRLGEVFVAARHASAPAEIDRLRKMPLRAPLIVVTITVHKGDPKVPDEELLLSTGAGVQNFMLALHAQGFASMWRTGPLAHASGVRTALGLAAHESIAGFIYVGTAATEPRKLAPLPVAEFVSEWQG